MFDGQQQRGRWCLETAVNACLHRSSKVLCHYHTSSSFRHPNNSCRSIKLSCNVSLRPTAELSACPMSSPVIQAKCRVDESRRIAQLGGMYLSHLHSASAHKLRVRSRFDTQQQRSYRLSLHLCVQQGCTAPVRVRKQMKITACEAHLGKDK